MRRRSALLPSAGGRRGSQSEADRVALPLRVDLLARVCEAIETIVLDSTATSIVSDAMVAHMYDPMSNGSENYVAASMLCEDFAIDLESIVLRDRPLEVLAGSLLCSIARCHMQPCSCSRSSLVWVYGWMDINSLSLSLSLDCWYASRCLEVVPIATATSSIVVYRGLARQRLDNDRRQRSTRSSERVSTCDTRLAAPSSCSMLATQARHRSAQTPGVCLLDDSPVCARARV